MYAEFTDNLVTGNEMIDSQHKELIERMNKLLESCEQSNDKAVAVKTLDYLADYTDYHSPPRSSFKEKSNIPDSQNITSSMRRSARPSKSWTKCLKRKKVLPMPS